MSAYTAAVLADSPVAYYRLDEASGNFADSSGNSRTATPSFGGAGAFTYNQTSLLSQDANASCAHVTNYNLADRATASGTLNPQSTDVTIEAWLSWPSDGGSDMTWAVWNAGSGGIGIGKVATTNVVQVVLWGVVATNFTTVLAANTTYHVVMTYYDAGAGNHSCDVYLNGALDQHKTSFGTMGSSANADFVFFNRRTGSNNSWKGTLDEVAYYATALSSTRILAHYNAATSAAATALAPANLARTALPVHRAAIR